MHLPPVDQGQTRLTRPDPGGSLPKVRTRGLNPELMETI